jgi:DNA repair protein RadD
MIELRSYQIDALNALWSYYQNGGNGNPLIALPTGTGKSILPAIFIKEVMRLWPNQRFMLVTHVSELIKQNAEVLREVWPEAPLGIYSAGLKQKEFAYPIVFAGIQSAIKNPAMFGHRDIIFVDEAHLISDKDNSQYHTFFATLKLINPHLKIIGMTATPFRMGMGYITDNGLFTDIVHDITGLEAFNKLIDDGYIAPLIPRRTKTQLDISNVGVQNGEYKANELQAAVDIDKITEAALQEIIHYGKDRRSWLIFSSGIEHAEHIAEKLEHYGITSAAVHSKQQGNYNDNAIAAFKNFEIQSLVNYGKLTTGFNHPAIDLIGMLRPTLSVPLWIQMLGRGTRPYEGKENCMVLDFAKNTPRLGPINDPVIPRKKGKTTGDAPVKICENCGAYNHAAARFCCDCGQEFEFKTKLIKSAGTEELIKSDKPIFETFDIQHAIYQKKQKIDRITNVAQGAPYIRVTYYTEGNLQSFSEMVFPEAKGLPRHKFKSWWQQRHTTEPPETVDQALQFIRELRCPKRITVHVNKTYPEILSAEY